MRQCVDCLLCLLGTSTRGCSTRDIPVDVGGIGTLANDVLEGLPTLANSRRGALVGDLCIDASGHLADGALDEAALRKAGSEENGVDRNENPRALLEKKGRSEDAEPEEDFKDGNESHAGIVILLHKLANGIRQTRCLWLCSTSCARSLLLALDGGQEVCSSVGGNVEDGVDCKGQDSERNLAREEPNEGHD